MTDMIKTVIPAGQWTQVAPAPVKNILIASLVGGWEIFIGPTAPSQSDTGLAVTSLDGSFTSSALDASDNVYARPFGASENTTLTVSGMKN